MTNEYHLYVPNNPFNASELSAMTYHGMLRPQFGPFYVDIDLPDTASQRAKSVRMVGERLISGSWTATLLTAAWIHLGGQAPEIFEAATASIPRKRRRSRIMPSAIRQSDYLDRAEVSEDDLQVIGGVVVTAPELTIVDLLRVGGVQRYQARVYELFNRIDLNAMRQRLQDQSSLPGMSTAQQLFESLVKDYSGAKQHVA
ncbi:hypothetical protein FB556_1437 [Enteractinococcus coprophilus]|uniref:Transcriptional regulator with AbiEi antitoxin domain of type IV toxin-antitoxin system n=2 Tax=Enteractinococcus coprophilus TaxID=1027633 RepID=A0A543AJJ9_9MICC|nr:hypothetical protein FB556_1437 [Enteractinococcus coprophilus]